MTVRAGLSLRKIAATTAASVLLACGLAHAAGWQPTADVLRTDVLIDRRQAAEKRDDAEAALAAQRELLVHWERVYGPESYEAESVRANIAERLADLGRTDEAVALMTPRLVSPGLQWREVVDRNLAVAKVYEDADRPKDAEPYVRAAWASAKDRKPADRRMVDLRLGKNLFVQRRFEEAIPYLEAAGDKSALADAYEAVGRFKDAEPLLKGRALADNLEKQGRYKEAEPLLQGERLARNLEKQGRIEEAISIRRDLQAWQVAKSGQYPGEDKALSQRTTPGVDEQLKIAGMLQKQGKHGEADRDFAAACAGLRTRTFMFYDPAIIKMGPKLTPELEAIALNPPPTDLQTCSRKRLVSLWQIGGGAPDSNTVDQALMSAQDSLYLPGGDGLARGVAERVATNAGAGPIISELKTINTRMNEAMLPWRRKWGDNPLAHMNEMSQADQDAMMREMYQAGLANKPLSDQYEATHRRLLTKVPAILDYALPLPVSLAELQIKGPRGQPLLRQNEVVVLFQFLPDTDRGMVFAVSRTRSAWAQISLTNKQLAALVDKLRAGIDSNDPNAGFPRQVAYDLHQALLGAPSIASVLDDGDRLMIVATGPMNGLPPGLLVTRPPIGDDANPAALRATRWLLREKTIAILPSLPSLRLLRSQEGRAAGSGNLLTVYDPSFSGKPGASIPPARSHGRGVAIARGAATELALLPRLSGTQTEGVELIALFPGQADKLTDTGASEVALRDAASTGKLRGLAILHFATHGLEPKDIDSLYEPALALAGPGGASKPPENDGVLTTTEIMTLGMDADWVILSACNTATGPQGYGSGIGGLALSFIFTGSRSVLASHWRIDDETSARIVIEAVRLSRAPPAQSGATDRASALRTASLEVLDDASRDDGDDYLAHPRYWAPFVLMGAFE